MAMLKAGVKRVLVRVPNWIGDAVMCLPALDALKALYPSAKLTLLAKARVVPVFENNPAVAGIIEYGEGHRGLLGRLRLAAELKRGGFDLAVLFQNAFDAAFISFLSRIPERAGHARDLRSPLLTRAITASDEVKKKHQVFYYLNIIEALGGKVPDRPLPGLYISEEESRWARRFLKERGLEGAPVFGAAPGASYGPAKRWPPERFASVLGALAAERKGAALVFGGPEDTEACAAVKAAFAPAIDLSGKLTLRQSMALVSLVEAVVTNDSGPMHISAALGVPTVAVFGSTEDSLTGPLGERVTVVRKKIECSPCFKRECRFGHYDCLRAIGADEVLTAIKGLAA
ncbi:MAG: lipopolysaccharide heptosyltransferase II [Deltaproteobacteria bacterium GWC2_55_46]|nr:MAG: lipopolysaccharide heptosyltransferase II [Deltaproteobacteria bacterium GWA2_55_82]OGQ62718.1 MAG: lipopolysaccharide heptosyltransferase II [Deltaproteobacteria bacterium RIFCSPLOWO2_02_FULL_55_12]OIJ74312.1 MAG: lipopolysaccharide heptosyltransferase II [Deltaproteobacteria bacterium GWC2_55_46]